MLNNKQRPRKKDWDNYVLFNNSRVCRCGAMEVSSSSKQNDGWKKFWLRPVDIVSAYNRSCRDIFATGISITGLFPYKQVDLCVRIKEPCSMTLFQYSFEVLY